MRIHTLPPSLIAKIAAGEVIERPSFALKELIENALDAKATTIAIFLENSGLTTIQVNDNGEGMEKEDLLESFKPHTTSKLLKDDSLLGIKTLGFRGEALAAIAAVSSVMIKSRTGSRTTMNYEQTNRERIGTQIEIKNGKLIHVSPVGMALGTVVTVKDIFSLVPARKKFLKSSQTELRHCIDVVINLALSHPGISFSLMHNKKILFQLPTNQTLLDRIINLFGREFAQMLIPISFEDSYIKIQGFLSKPQIATSSYHKQFLFVNNRPISDRIITTAIKESYGNLLEPKANPPIVLFISLPFELVDVNVHPRKEYVHFINNKLVFEMVAQAVSQVLKENNLTFRNLSWKEDYIKTTTSFAGRTLKQDVLTKEDLKIKPDSQIMQVHNLYLFSSVGNGLCVVDQHAAHERILFEKLKKEFLKKRAKPLLYPLPTPVVLDLSLSEKIALDEHKKELEKMGFILISQLLVHSSKKKNRSTINYEPTNQELFLTHLPLLFQDRNHQQLVNDLLANILDEKPLSTIDSFSHKMLAFLACRAAVKAGDALSQEQMKKIILDLEETEKNSTCPHGRPTKIAISLKQLHKMFRRI